MATPEVRNTLILAAAAAAVLGAIVLAFSALGSAVSSDRLPGQVRDLDSASTVVTSPAAERGVPSAGAEERRSPAESATPEGALASVAAPAAGTASAGEEAPSKSGSGPSSDGFGTGPGPGVPSPTDPGPQAPAPAPAPTAPPVETPAPVPPPMSAPEAGLVEETVATLDETVTETTGLDLPLDSATAPVTEPVDDLVQSDGA